MSWSLIWSFGFCLFSRSLLLVLFRRKRIFHSVFVFFSLFSFFFNNDKLINLATSPFLFLLKFSYFFSFYFTSHTIYMWYRQFFISLHDLTAFVNRLSIQLKWRQCCDDAIASYTTYSSGVWFDDKKREMINGTRIDARTSLEQQKKLAKCNEQHSLCVWVPMCSFFVHSKERKNNNNNMWIASYQIFHLLFH